MDEIRGVEMATRKTYSYMLTESLVPQNDEVRRLRQSDLKKSTGYRGTLSFHLCLTYL